MEQADGAKVRFTSVDHYISSFPPEVRAKLEEVRATIKAAAPDATEGISYQIAGFKRHTWFVYFSGWKDFISMYPSLEGDEAFQAAIAPYRSGKGTLRFPIDQPLPLELIRRFVQLRLAEDDAQAATKAAKKTAAKAARKQPAPPA